MVKQLLRKITYDKTKIIADIVLQFFYLGKNYLDEKGESSCVKPDKFSNCLQKIKTRSLLERDRRHGFVFNFYGESTFELCHKLKFKGSFTRYKLMNGLTKNAP